MIYNSRSLMAKKAMHLALGASLLLAAPLAAQNFQSDQFYVADFRAVAKHATPAVVSVRVKRAAASALDSDEAYESFNEELLRRFFGVPQQQQRRRTPQVPEQGQASGFLISSDGYILTNNHVVKDAGEVTVIFNDGTDYVAKVIGTDDNTDVALLKIEGAESFPYLKIGNSDELEVGQWVLAVGNPMGLQASVTAGVVSAKGRNNLDIANIEDFIQTDAAINRGNSGGPLLNTAGEVVGMSTAMLGTFGNVGIGFAIPSNILLYTKDQLLNEGKVTRGFLGLTMQSVDRNLAHSFGLAKAEGALVAEIVSDSPAEKAGLQQGDIIVRYNGISLQNIATLRNAIAMMPPGRRLVLDIIREGKPMKVEVLIGAFPSKATASLPALGFDVENLTPEAAKTYGYSEEKGVVISRVDPYSAAGLAGLKKGVLILSVNKKPIKNTEEYREALQNREKNQPLLLLVRQGSVTRFISIRVE